MAGYRSILESGKDSLNWFHIILIGAAVLSFSLGIRILLFQNNPDLAYFLGSVGVTILLLLIVEWRRHYESRMMFLGLVGKYDCYSYKEEYSQDSSELKPIQPDAITLNGNEAEIWYESNNLLGIKHAEYEKNSGKKIVRGVWEGKVVMADGNIGSVVWYYSKLKGEGEPWKRNGLKRLAVIRDDSKKMRIILFSDHDERFGREVFIPNGSP